MAFRARTSDTAEPRSGAGAVALALLGFSAALAVFLLVPPFLTGQFGWVAGFTGQEASDLLTPIVVLPLFVLAVERTGHAGTPVRVVVAALLAMWVVGQGIHLAGNAIGDMFEKGAVRDAFYATPAGRLDEFLDEELSHWVWHIAWVGLLFLLLSLGGRSAAGGAAVVRDAGPAALAVAALAGILQGFTWFVVTDIGETWQLAIPAMVVLGGLSLRARRWNGADAVVTIFLLATAAVSLGLYVVWIVIGGFPPPSILDRLPILG